MAIPGISDLLLKHAFSASIEGNTRVSPLHSKHDLYVAAMALYISTLHKLVMDSWHKFSEAQKDIAQDNKEHHQVRQKRLREREGQRKISEARHHETKLESHEHRHLKIPV